MTEPAAVHLEATLEPRRGTPVVKALRTAASIASTLLAGDMTSGPSVLDLVVRRKATGGEVLRVPAGVGEEPDILLARVRADLAEKGVEEFVGEWRLPG